MSLTTKELAVELKSRGYRIAERTIKNYHSLGLLPEATRKGEYMKGVNLVFPDEALSDLLRIFELKGRGYPLKEIKQDLEQERWGRLIKEHQERLSRFVQVDGRYYLTLQNLNPKYYGKFQNLWAAVSSNESLWTRQKSAPEGVSAAIMREIENRGIYQTTRIFDGDVVYELTGCCIETEPWVILKKRYGFSWDVLSSLFEKHADDCQKYVLFPSPDGIRFSHESIGYERRNHLNQFGEALLDCIEFIKNGGLVRYNELTRHDRWDSVNDFIEGFLSGTCAFVPDLYAEYPKLFLKRFDMNS